jgi:formylglycine-generating enzyme required for sulfatase activity
MIPRLAMIGLCVGVALWAPAMAQGPLSAGEESGLSAGSTFKECDVCPQMVVVPAGTFAMGSSDDE